MGIEHLVVLGATGDVGRGIVAQAVERGWAVTAVGRRDATLREVAAAHPDGRVAVQTGDVSTSEGARDLVSALTIDGPIAVVVAISVPWRTVRVLDTDYAAAADYWRSYLGAHVAAIQAFVPALPAGSVLLGIGGGMADFVAPGQAVVSMSQAAERMLYRTLHAEVAERGIEIRELMIVSRVLGHSDRHGGAAPMLTDREVGERVCEILADPGAEPHLGPVLKITPAR